MSSATVSAHKGGQATSAFAMAGMKYTPRRN